MQDPFDTGRAVLCYKVKWEGYPESANSWIPAAECQCPNLIALYENEARKAALDGYALDENALPAVGYRHR